MLDRLKWKLHKARRLIFKYYGYKHPSSKIANDVVIFKPQNLYLYEHTAIAMGAVIMNWSLQTGWHHSDYQSMLIGKDGEYPSFFMVNSSLQYCRGGRCLDWLQCDIACRLSCGKRLQYRQRKCGERQYPALCSRFRQSC